MKKKIIVIFVNLIILRINALPDPLEGVRFGNIEEKKFIEIMIEKKIFSLLTNDKDSLLRYSLLGVPIVVFTNPNHYYKGNLTDIYLSLGSDSVYSKSLNKKYLSYGRGQVEKFKAEKVFQQLITWYGKPDTLVKTSKYDELLKYKTIYKEKKQNKSEEEVSNWKLDLSPMPNWKVEQLKKQNYEDSICPPMIRAVWKTKNFILTYEVGYPTRDTVFNGEYYYKEYESPLIKYVMYDYSGYIEKLKDSISNIHKPNDYLDVSAYSPKWERINDLETKHDTKFTFVVANIKRKEKESRKHISAFRFDIILVDDFNEELVRIKNFTHTFEKAIYSIRNESYVLLDDERRSYSFNYNSGNWKDDVIEELEKARKYSQQNKVRLKIVITSLRFTDGSVLTN